MTTATLTRDEKIAEAKRLRSRGWGPKSIGKELGVGRRTIERWLNPKVAERDREHVRRYKETRRRPCPTCGRPMTSDAGASASKPPSQVCGLCAPDEYRKWTRERIIEAIREWARRRGRAPTSSEWLGPNLIDPDGYEFPGAGSVYDHRRRRQKARDPHHHEQPFDSWADAIEAAGFPRPGSARNYVDKHLWEVENMGDTTVTREYLVLQVAEGDLVVHDVVDARTTSEAVEMTAKEPGRYRAVALSSLTEYNVAPRMVATPNRNGTGAEE